MSDAPVKVGVDDDIPDGKMMWCANHSANDGDNIFRFYPNSISNSSLKSLLVIVNTDAVNYVLTQLKDLGYANIRIRW